MWALRNKGIQKAVATKYVATFYSLISCSRISHLSLGERVSYSMLIWFRSHHHSYKSGTVDWFSQPISFTLINWERNLVLEMMFQFPVTDLKSPLKVRYMFEDLFPLYTFVTSLNLSVTTFYYLWALSCLDGRVVHFLEANRLSPLQYRELWLQKDKRFLPLE